MRTGSAVPLPVPPALFSRESGVRPRVPRSFRGPGRLAGHRGRGAGDTQRTARPSPSPGHTWAGTRPAERGGKTGASGAPSGRPLAARGHQEAERQTQESHLQKAQRWGAPPPGNGRRVALTLHREPTVPLSFSHFRSTRTGDTGPHGRL